MIKNNQKMPNQCEVIFKRRKKIHGEWLKVSEVENTIKNASLSSK